MYFHPICRIHLSNESTVITISVDDIWCLKVLPIRYQQIIGEVEVARRMQANVLFCGQFTIGPVTSKNTSRKITSHLDVHILFPLVWSGLVWPALVVPMTNMWVVCLQRCSNTCVQMSTRSVWNLAGAAAGAGGIWHDWEMSWQGDTSANQRAATLTHKYPRTVGTVCAENE